MLSAYTALKANIIFEFWKLSDQEPVSIGNNQYQLVNPVTNNSMVFGGGEDGKYNVQGVKERLLQTFIIGTKAEAFRFEKEWRKYKFEDDGSKILFRIKNGIIVPYVEIVLPKDYLRTIVIGPTRKSEDTITSLRYFLRSKGYDPKSIGISSSKVPYRG